MTYDVVIAGAGVAGCTAAILYGRAGLRVAIIEKHHNISTHKALCGHFVLGGAQPMLRRTGLWESMVAAGAAVGGIARWTAAGWSVPGPGLPECISLRREKLDPLLRTLAAGTPGVDLVLGRAVTGLLESGGRVTGVRVGDEEIPARLVVAADGHRSPVARLAGVAEDVAPNERFGLWAYYRGVVPRGPAGNHVWFLDPDVGILVRTDHDLHMLVAFPAKTRLDDFQADRAGALERFMASLPDAPDLSSAERVSKVIGTNDYPCVKREPTPRPGLVLVGDAAITGDPTPAVGCGWAFRGAEWLVESTAPALLGGGDLQAGVAAYRKALGFVIDHDRYGRRDALARPSNPVEKLIARAALRDPELARRVYLFAMRSIPAGELINPRTLVRAAWTLARTSP
ncbi:FAD-dependent oxidoreductase [Acrocarpospora phusangensis]|uniref:FAD-dependent oxidoreductase n=1 Tax=Acrocarpospora phusangensis TaxID=1070424 RepID=A0A919UKI2_9ACTN|nr:NAD(P)/FAD-dependent oxidoreductase [Acrocarpospora phusangensis]GIH25054.1 FAD-dependent oxidoreductase [Acrocarpospora phusangensis]